MGVVRNWAGKKGWQALEGPACHSNHFGFYFLSKEEPSRGSNVARPMILKPVAVYSSVE